MMISPRILVHSAGSLCVCVCFCCVQLCLTVWEQWTVCSLPSSSVHENFQARILEWVAISSSRRSPTQGSNLHLLHWQAEPPGKPLYMYNYFHLIPPQTQWHEFYYYPSVPRWGNGASRKLLAQSIQNQEITELGLESRSFWFHSPKP